MLLQAMPEMGDAFMGIGAILMGLLPLLLIFVGIPMLNKKKTLVLKKFELTPDNVEGSIVKIVARNSGLFSWALTNLFQISPETSFSVTAKEICFNRQGISSEENALITLKKGVSHIYWKFQKPFWLLALSVVVLLGGLILAVAQSEMGVVIIFTIIAVVLFTIYYFKKSIAIVVETCGGNQHEIIFKPSFVEGKDVDIEMAIKTVETIQNQIIKQQA